MLDPQLYTNMHTNMHGKKEKKSWLVGRENHTFIFLYHANASHSVVISVHLCILFEFERDS